MRARHTSATQHDAHVAADHHSAKERIRLSARGVLLLALACATFEAFALCALLELHHVLPAALAWLLPAEDARLSSASLWLLLVAVPVTGVASFAPGSIISHAVIQPAPSIAHRSKKSPTSTRSRLQDGYFQVFQLVAWLLYAAFLSGFAWSHWTAYDAAGERTTLAVLAFIAETLLVSSVLALERHAPRSPRRERLVVMANNFANMLLTVGALVLACSAELARQHRENAYALTVGADGVALVVTAVFNTYGLGGVLAPKAGWKFYQPFTGGAKFMLFQAISWTCFAVGLFLQGLYLLSVVILELELFVGATALAGSLFLVSEVLMVMSLLVFKGSSTTATNANANAKTIQQQLRDVAEDCLGAFLVGLFANVQWVPSALFVVLFAVTTRLSALQVLLYVLLTTFVEALIIISRSIAVHLYNQDSKYGKRTEVSEFRAKYLFPQVTAMLLPAVLAYTHYKASHDAALPFTILAVAFYVYVPAYAGQPQVTGARKKQHWVTQRSEVMEKVADYFDGQLFREAPLDPQQHYILGFHPHGILTSTVQWLQFSQRWRDLFPGVYGHILTASVLHQIPLARDVLQFFGGREVSRQAFVRALENNESVMLVPGGQAEMLEQRSGQKQVRVYTHHKGFIRLAIEHGVPLVPVLSFKEGETMDNVQAPMVQRWFIKRLAFPFPYFPYGRLGLPIPRRVKMAIAVGAPLVVEKHEHPTPAQVEAVHAEYFERVRGLFDKYKDAAGCHDYTLQLM